MRKISLFLLLLFLVATTYSQLAIESPAEFEKKGQQFVAALNQHPSIKEIRQKGLMMGVELSAEFDVGQLLALFQENGLIVDQFLFNEHSFRIAPPLTITIKEISQICETILKCLDQLANEKN